MSSNNNQQAQRRRQSQAQRPAPRPTTRAADIWLPAAPLPELHPVSTSSDAAALVRSLGDPPLSGRSVIAGHYVAAVVDSAAALATALAMSADLLATDDDGVDHD